ncbi:hypothetical protein SY88_07590 [Clostridiales bacterium PH28_bin88]|nr:hypothetical protein SY88_07590 [Clostridiales bacterium PH28_bin88]
MVKVMVHINNFRINDVDTGSVVAIGTNYFYHWNTWSKVNGGFGRLTGDQNSLADFVTGVDDPDWQDMLSNEWLTEPALRKLVE